MQAQTLGFLLYLPYTKLHHELFPSAGLCVAAATIRCDSSEQHEGLPFPELMGHGSPTTGDKAVVQRLKGTTRAHWTLGGGIRA